MCAHAHTNVASRMRIPGRARRAPFIRRSIFDPCEFHSIDAIDYLKGTLNHGLFYSRNESTECVGFSDSDWGGDLDDRKSTSGYLFQLGGTAISWRSKKQTCVALSTAEAEYMALASAAQEAMWLRQLTINLKNEPVSATVIFEDNHTAICIAKNPQFHGRSKHIAVPLHSRSSREQAEILQNK